MGIVIIYRAKLHADRSLERLKARLEAKGFHQEKSVDFLETFSLVIKPSSIRTALTVAVIKGWPIRQLDVKKVFVNGHLDVPVYME